MDRKREMDAETIRLLARLASMDHRPFATGVDIILIIASVWLAFHFDSILPMMLLGLSPQAHR